MNLGDSRFYKILQDTLGTLTSRDKLRQVIKVPLYSNAIFLMGASAFSALIGFVFWMIARALLYG